MKKWIVWGLIAVGVYVLWVKFGTQIKGAVSGIGK